ncbi:maleylpyruvate isomerase N-terminal domain-containing protein [Allosaccharopolyspora coralli]|nr:maleylpyruvate isomerase N-terminal domain-containing protein [Allosaccharopolyspora coralli]
MILGCADGRHPRRTIPREVSVIDLKPACTAMTSVLAHDGESQLDARTRCTEFAVRDLIDHVAAVAHGFSALARAEADATTMLTTAELRGAWLATVAEHVRDLGAAWDDRAAWPGTSTGGGVELANEVWGRIALTGVT